MFMIHLFPYSPSSLWTATNVQDPSRSAWPVNPSSTIDNHHDARQHKDIDLNEEMSGFSVSWGQWMMHISVGFLLSHHRHQESFLELREGYAGHGSMIDGPLLPSSSDHPAVAALPPDYTSLPYDVRHQILSELPFEVLLSQMRQLSQESRSDFMSLIQSKSFMHRLALSLQADCETCYIEIQVEITNFLNKMGHDEDRFPYATWLADPASVLDIESQLKDRSLAELTQVLTTSDDALETLHCLLKLSCARREAIHAMRDRFRAHVHRQIKRTKMIDKEATAQEVIGMSPAVFSVDMVKLARLGLTRLEAFKERD